MRNPLQKPHREELAEQEFKAFRSSLVAQRVKCLPAMWEIRVRSLGWEVPWRRKWQPTPVPVPGKSHGWRSLVGYSPGGHKELDTTERLYLFFRLEMNIYVLVCFMGFYWKLACAWKVCFSSLEWAKLDSINQEIDVLSIHWKDWCWSWSSNILATENWLIGKEPDAWERARARGEAGDSGWDGWRASLVQWTWVWTNSGRWWRTGKRDVMPSMGSQRVRHDLVTEQQKFSYCPRMHFLDVHFHLWLHFRCITRLFSPPSSCFQLLWVSFSDIINNSI